MSVRLANIHQGNLSNGTKSQWIFSIRRKSFGAAKNREQFQKVLEDLQKSDIIYFTNLTRITRST